MQKISIPCFHCELMGGSFISSKDCMLADRSERNIEPSVNLRKNARTSRAFSSHNPGYAHMNSMARRRRSRKSKVLSFCFLSFCLFNVGMPAGAIRSNGIGGGRWSEPATWEGGKVPSGGSVVVLDRDVVGLFEFCEVQTVVAAS